MAWDLEGFARTLTSASDATVRAYRADLAAFVEWAERGSLAGPEAVDRRTLRRYLSWLQTRRYARRSIARKASALRRYFAWLVRTGHLADDPAAGLSAPSGSGRLPRVLRADELTALLDAPPGGHGVGQGVQAAAGPGGPAGPRRAADLARPRA